MPLRSLAAFRDRLPREKREESTPGLRSSLCHFEVILDTDGSFVALHKRTDKNKLGTRILGVPIDPTRTNNILPGLAIDDMTYVCSLERFPNRHQMFLEVLQNCFEATGDPSIGAMLRFYRDHNGAEVIWNEIILALFGPEPSTATKQVKWAEGVANFPEHKTKGPKSKMVAFVVDDQMAHDSDAVLGWYLNTHYKQNGNQKGVFLGSCFVCGREDVPIPEVHKGFSKSLITANKKAYQFGGLPGTKGCCVCEDCGSKANQAFDYLLNSGKHKLPLYHHKKDKRDLLVIWGDGDGDPDLPGKVIDLGRVDPDATQLKAVMTALAEGKRGNIAAELNCLLIRNNDHGRLVVLNFQPTTLAEVEKNFQQFMDRQQVGYQERYFGICWGRSSLLAAICWPPSKLWSDSHSLAPKAPPGLFPALWEHALFGIPLPQRILPLAISAFTRHLQKEKPPIAPAAALSLCLHSHYKDFPMTTPDLTDNVEKLPEELRAPYQMGRYLVLADNIFRRSTDSKKGKLSGWVALALRRPPIAFAKATLSLLRHGANVPNARITPDFVLSIDQIPGRFNQRQQAALQLGVQHALAIHWRGVEERKAAKAAQTTEEP